MESRHKFLDVDSPKVYFRLTSKFGTKFEVRVCYYVSFVRVHGNARPGLRLEQFITFECCFVRRHVLLVKRVARRQCPVSI